jgi:hypothetical protein
MVEGVTNTNDIALLDKNCWQKAVSAWALSLHDGDIDEAIISIKKAYVDYINATGEPHRPTVISFHEAQQEEYLRSTEQLEKQREKELDNAAKELGEAITPPPKSNGKGKGNGKSSVTTLPN